MEGREARYHEDRDWTDDKSISQTHAKDSKNDDSYEAVDSLKMIPGKCEVPRFR